MCTASSATNRAGSRPLDLTTDLISLAHDIRKTEMWLLSVVRALTVPPFRTEATVACAAFVGVNIADCKEAAK